MPFSKFEVVPGTCGEPCFQLGEWIAPAGWCNIVFRDHERLGHQNAANRLVWWDSYRCWIKDKVGALGYPGSHVDLGWSVCISPLFSLRCHSQCAAINGEVGGSACFVPDGTPSSLHHCHPPLPQARGHESESSLVVLVFLFERFLEVCCSAMLIGLSDPFLFQASLKLFRHKGLLWWDWSFGSASIRVPHSSSLLVEVFERQGCLLLKEVTF